MRTKGLKIAFLTVVLIISIISLSATAADDVKATNYPFFTKVNVSGGTSTPSPVDLLLGSITGTGDEQENLVLLDTDNAKTASGSWIKPIPVQFIRNAGQAGDEVRFEIVSETGSIFFTDYKTVFALSSPDNPGDSEVFSQQFAGATTTVVEGIKPLPGKVNFFIGSNQNNWYTNVDTYEGIHYIDLYPGIDLIYQGIEGNLKSEFLLAPHSDPGLIRIQYEGISSIAKGGDGSLVISTRSGTFKELKPDAYQMINGQKMAVSVDYTIVSPNEMGFRVGNYDNNYPLVIDPVMRYGIYLAGIGVADARAVTKDPDGNAYVAGRTYTGFTLPGPGEVVEKTGTDAIVVKINADGSAPLDKDVPRGEQERRCCRNCP